MYIYIYFPSESAQTRQVRSESRRPTAPAPDSPACATQHRGKAQESLGMRGLEGLGWCLYSQKRT